MAAARKPGSLLDLLPKRGDVEYNALPKFVRDEIDIIHKGGRPVVPGDLQEIVALLVGIPERIAALAAEHQSLAAEIRVALKNQITATSNLVKAVAEIQKEQAASRLWLIDHEKRLDAHDVQFGVHASKHVEHDKKHTALDAHVTGIHKRLVVVEEQIVTKCAPKKPRGKKRP
jgi:hypothetical protein